MCVPKTLFLGNVSFWSACRYGVHILHGKGVSLTLMLTNGSFTVCMYSIVLYSTRVALASNCVSSIRAIRRRLAPPAPKHRFTKHHAFQSAYVIVQCWRQTCWFVRHIR